MRTRFGILLGGVIATMAIASARAESDPYAHCREVLSEVAFKNAGGALAIVSAPDMSQFPPGILNNCLGDIEYHGVVKEDGTITLVGVDHGVICGTSRKLPDDDLRSAAWHDSVIRHRFRALRYAAPTLAGKPVCVKIERAWIPEVPHRFWSPEEWAHRK